MKATLLSIQSLILSYVLLMLGTGLLSTLVALRSDIESFSVFVTGLIMSSFFVGMLLGAFYSVLLVIRVGHIRAFGVYASIMSTMSILHALGVDPFAWMAVRALTGFCMAGLVLITEAWINERVDNRLRGVVLALYMAVGYASAGLGQFVLPFYDPAGFDLFAFVTVIFSIALVPVLMTRAPSPRPATRERISLSELYRISPVAAVGSFIAGMLNSAVYGLGPLFTSQIGLPLSATSTFMACIITGGLVLQIPIGRVSDRFDRRKVLAAVAFAAAASCAAIIASAGTGGVWLYVAAAVYGSLAFTMYSLCAAQANDLTPPDKLLQTSGGLLIAYGLGAIAGPPLGGLVMGYFGPLSLFMYFMASSAGIGAYTLYRMNVRRPGDAKRTFVPASDALPADQTLYDAACEQVEETRATQETVQDAERSRPARGL